MFDSQSTTKLLRVYLLLIYPPFFLPSHITIVKKHSVHSLLIKQELQLTPAVSIVVPRLKLSVLSQIKRTKPASKLLPLIPIFSRRNPAVVSLNSGLIDRSNSYCCNIFMICKVLINNYRCWETNI